MPLLCRKWFDLKESYQRFGSGPAIAERKLFDTRATLVLVDVLQYAAVGTVHTVAVMLGRISLGPVTKLKSLNAYSATRLRASSAAWGAVEGNTVVGPSASKEGCGR